LWKKTKPTPKKATMDKVAKINFDFCCIDLKFIFKIYKFKVNF